MGIFRMEVFMKLRQLLEGLEYEQIQGDVEQDVTGVVYDSRKVVDGSVFICIKGTKTDSHDFAIECVKSGARALIVEQQVLNIPEYVTVIRVANSRTAMAGLAAAWFEYPITKMISIGVTGTKGKTTTTYMIKSILEAAGKKVGLIGTAGVMIGDDLFPTINTTPESYQLHEYFAQMVNAGCEYVIMEVSSQGIMMHRTDGIIYDYGIFTNISNDHIGPDEHQTFEEYLYYKSQLLKMCKIGLVNKDDEHYQQIVQGAECQLFTYSLARDADFTATDIEYLSGADFVGVGFQAGGRLTMSIRVGIPGKFNVENALAAIGIVSFLDLPDTAVKEGLKGIKVNGRMEIVHTSERCTVIVDYAHNAVSMESLLTTLREYHPKRLVCVFGCGGNRSKDRRYAMGEIGGKYADLSIITADNSRFEKVADIIADIRGSIEKTGGKFIEIPDRKEAISYSIMNAKPGDMIAIIGKGHENYQEIEGVRYHFSDREVVTEVTSRWN